MSDNYESTIADWKDRETVAEAMIPIIGQLYRERNIMTYVYGRPLINRSVISLLKTHRFVRQVEEEELHVQDTQPILKAMLDLNVGTCHIDAGKLAIKYRKEGNGQSVEEFVKQETAHVTDGSVPDNLPQDVVLYGFGRIGRLMARLLIERTGSGDAIRLRAIVVRDSGGSDLVKRASLLRRDSVHGSFKGTITVDEENNCIVANGNRIQVIYANSPDSIDYTQYGINNAVVVDNTGIWRDEDGLGLHLKSKGTSKVLLTAPGKGDLKNIVFGINNDDITDDDKIISAASCTTNAITPILKAVYDKFGIAHGHVETVHSYTNDQNLIDNFHKGDRRGRSAPLNMVISETGAAKAVAKAFPELKGKLTGNAIRVPTPNVSLAILNLNLDKATNSEDMNAYLRHMALHSSLQKQIDYVNSPEVVSSDFVGSSHAGIVDSLATNVEDKNAVLYIWYDNEYGYSCQVVRILQQMSNVEYTMVPKDA